MGPRPDLLASSCVHQITAAAARERERERATESEAVSLPLVSVSVSWEQREHRKIQGCGPTSGFIAISQKTCPVGCAIFFTVHSVHPNKDMSSISLLRLAVISCFIAALVSGTTPGIAAQRPGELQQSEIDTIHDESSNASNPRAKDDMSVYSHHKPIPRDLEVASLLDQQTANKTRDFMMSYRFLASSMFLSFAIMLKRHSPV